MSDVEESKSRLLAEIERLEERLVDLQQQLATLDATEGELEPSATTPPPVQDRGSADLHAGERSLLEVQREVVEQALRLSEARFHAFMDHLPEVVLIKDREGRYLYGNKTARANIAPARDTLEGLTAYDHFAPEIAEAVEAHDREVLAGGRAVTREALISAPGEEPNWMRETKFPLRDASGQMVLGIIAFDITRQRQTLAAVEAQRALANALVHTAETVNQSLELDAVLERILDSVETVVPHDGANILFLDEEQTGLHVAQICACYRQAPLMPPPLGEMLPLAERPPLEEMKTTGRPLLVANTDGDPRWVAAGEQIASYVGAPILADGAIIGFLNLVSATPGFFTAEDRERLRAFAPQAAIAIRNAQLHESVQTQLERLRQAQARLVQSEKLAAIGELVAGVAHELNNPLAGIVLHSQLLQRKRPGSRMESSLNHILEQARRASGIVNGLLDFARQHPHELEAVQLNEVLRSTIDLLTYEVRTHNVALHVELAPTLPLIQGDIQQLQQVFVNLLNNALQALQGRQDARVTIRSKRAPAQYAADAPNPDDVVLVTITDNGPGMPEPVRKRIFDPFFTTKEPGQGTGLGLSICHGIIGEHRGQIWVESGVGEGTTFFVELPLAPTLLENGERTAPPPESLPAAPEQRILIVDDELSIRQALTRILSPGYRVDAVASGRDALEKVAGGTYDLLICDLHMPDLSGLAFHEAWHRQWPDQARSVPLLFITGDTVSSYVKEELARIEAPILHKPFGVETLLALVESLLHPAK